MNSADVPEPGWAFAEEFDVTARTLTGPAGELLAAVAATADIDVLAELLEVLESMTEDEELARRYAGHLSTLAELLPDPAGKLLGAGVDLVLAAMCTDEDQWAEAAQRLRRCRADVEEFLPGLVGDAEQLLGRHALHDDRPAAAHAHWTRARARFLADERWGEAATTTGALAELATHQPDTTGAEALWREAATLFRRAEFDDDVRTCAGSACELVAARIGEMHTGQETHAHALAVETYAFGVDHGVTGTPVASLALLAGLFGSDGPTPWEDVHAWFETARREFVVASENDLGARRTMLAEVDRCEGFAAVGRNRNSEAEALLTAALGVYREEGTAEDVEMCQSQLTGLLMTTEPAGDRADSIARTATWTDPDAVIGAGVVRALTLLRDGRHADATTVLDEVARTAEKHRIPHKAVAARLYVAFAALGQHDAGPARRCLVEVDRYLLESDATLPRQAVMLLSGLARTLMISLAEFDGDVEGKLAHLARLEADLTAFGWHQLAAHVAVMHGHALHAAGHSEHAVRVGLPAVLALDAVRFSLVDAQRRRSWAAAVAAGFGMVLRAAVAADDVRLVAEIIEVVRGNPVPEPSVDATDAVTALAGLWADADRETGPPQVATAGSPALSAVDLLSGDEHRTALGLPAYVRTPWGSIALGEHLQRARRYQDPVRAPVTVEWRIVPESR